MPDSSPSPAAPASYGSRDAVPAYATSAVNGPQKRQLRLRTAEADRNFAAPLQHQTRQRWGRTQEIPANADVAQLVEHFTRNEGVPGSSPGVGSRRSSRLKACDVHVCIGRIRRECAWGGAGLRCERSGGRQRLLCGGGAGLIGAWLAVVFGWSSVAAGRVRGRVRLR